MSEDNKEILEIVENNKQKNTIYTQLEIPSGAVVEWKGHSFKLVKDALVHADIRNIGIVSNFLKEKGITSKKEDSGFFLQNMEEASYLVRWKFPKGRIITWLEANFILNEDIVVETLPLVAWRFMGYLEKNESWEKLVETE